IERALLRSAQRASLRQSWTVGSEILLRGTKVVIEVLEDVIRLGNEELRGVDISADLESQIQCFLWGVAANEFPPRVFQHATQHNLRVRRVTVRNQRARWGSCSSRGTISLNWRLIQTPAFVQDYLILHELMHLR